MSSSFQQSTFTFFVAPVQTQSSTPPKLYTTHRQPSALPPANEKKNKVKRRWHCGGVEQTHTHTHAFSSLTCHCSSPLFLLLSSPRCQPMPLVSQAILSEPPPRYPSCKERDRDKCFFGKDERKRRKDFKQKQTSFREKPAPSFKSNRISSQFRSSAHTRISITCCTRSRARLDLLTAESAMLSTSWQTCTRPRCVLFVWSE